MTSTENTPRLRADARRNRDRIIAAARTAFAEQGTDVPMEEIARAAGVGVGTLYRRFPDRDSLIPRSPATLPTGRAMPTAPPTPNRTRADRFLHTAADLRIAVAVDARRTRAPSWPPTRRRSGPNDLLGTAGPPGQRGPGDASLRRRRRGRPGDAPPVLQGQRRTRDARTATPATDADVACKRTPAPHAGQPGHGRGPEAMLGTAPGEMTDVDRTELLRYADRASTRSRASSPTR